MSDGLANRADYPVFFEIATRWQDNDVYGHLNNVVYYELLDTVVNRHLIEAGVLDPETSDQIGLVVESGCKYFASLAYPENVDVGLRVAHIGNSSVRYEVGAFAKGADTAAAEAFFVHVYVDAETRRPKPLPDAFRAVLVSIRR
ncbi:acyl-CoA thioesterase [Hyphobacterium sp.]|uniref:acyl-CoA thioesterase n=1 Tax=Hyphobacterium sp. TaxID=2004662 RepID=UPI003BACBDD6